MRSIRFEGMAVDLGYNIALWTDGLMLANDNGPLNAFRLIPGNHYEVIVREIKEKETK